MNNLDAYGFLIVPEEELEFELSIRQQVNFKAVAEKIQKIQAQPFIIDMSINGFSQVENFDFNINERKFSEIKSNFKKGVEAQQDPEALTIKRSIRVMAKATTMYILKNKIKTPLQKYNPKVASEFTHLGAHFNAPKEVWPELLILWKNYDKERKTSIADSVQNIFDMRELRKF